MTRIFIVHGYGATPKSNWTPWLSQKVISDLGIPVNAIHLPNSRKPSLDAWLATLSREIAHPDADTFIIAHSLGCITLLDFIESLPDHTRIGGVIMVSAFDEPLYLLPIVRSFTERKPDYVGIIGKIDRIRVIGSTNDILVPLELTKRVAESLQSKVFEIPNAGHFTTRDRYRTFVELYDILVEMIGPEGPSPEKGKKES